MAHEDATREDGAPAEAAPAGPGRITRVVLKNYKSIVSCDVALQSLTILVGPNGSGKSNFLDALAFVSEALTVGLDQAIRNRGNLDRILSASRPAGDDSFSIELHFQLGNGRTGRYRFEIGTTPEGGFAVSREQIDPDDRVDNFGQHPYWMREYGITKWTSDTGLEMDPLDDNRLFLVHLASDARVRPVYDLLTSMAFYNPLPDQMRSPIERDSAPRLLTGGRNAASILRRIQADDTGVEGSISQYLKRVLPGLEWVTATEFQGYDYLTFGIHSPDGASAHQFAASQVSDGTLRALAILVALFQGRLGGKSTTSLVGIEEPENNIHPAAARILLAAMQTATDDTQVLVTTHSADMLHMGDVDMSSVLVVSAEDGVTKLGRIDAVSQSIVRDNIYTVGELLQMDQLRSEPPTDAVSGDAATPEPSVGRT